MQTLLHVSASPRGGISHSRRVAIELIAHWKLMHPGLLVVDRDLAACPLPHPSASFVAASLAADETRTPNDREALATSELLIAELAHADALLISTPMHNFTIPSALKAWIDHIARPGRTFRSTARGKQGLLRDRPVRIVLACGGAIASGTGHQEDWASPYLRYVFGVMGMTTLDVLILENCNRGKTTIDRETTGAEMAERIQAFASLGLN